MSALAWVAVCWVLLIVGLMVAGCFLYRRNLRDRDSSPGDHGLKLVVDDPAAYMRQQLLDMSQRRINSRFEVIWANNFPEAKRADEHFNRIANEVVPDTARKPKPHNNGGNK